MFRGFTLKFQLRRLWQRSLNLIYPDSRPVCALCQRPMGTYDDGERQAKAGAQERPQTRQRGHFTGAGQSESGRDTCRESHSQLEDGSQTVGEDNGDVENQAEEAHTLLDGVCFFCLQDASVSSFKPWKATIAFRNLPVVTDQQQRHAMTVSGQAEGEGIGRAVVEVPLFCAVTYEGIIRDTVRHWKYDGKISFTRYLATLILGGIHRTQTFQACRWNCIVPVPTSRDRWRKRGYHHVGLLARELEQMLDIPYCEALVRKESEGFTQSQTAKTAHERKRSLRGEYGILEATDIRGWNILLIDDVITTGATVATCAEVLLRAGASSVFGVAVAHVQ